MAAISRISWSAPFANLWSSSPSPSQTPGASSSSPSSSGSSTTTSTRVSTSSKAPFPSYPSSSTNASRSATTTSYGSSSTTYTRQTTQPQPQPQPQIPNRTRTQTQTQTQPQMSQPFQQQQHRRRLQSHVTVPPRIEEHVLAEALSDSVPGQFPTTTTPSPRPPPSSSYNSASPASGSVAETVAVITAARKRHNATPRVQVPDPASIQAGSSSLPSSSHGHGSAEGGIGVAKRPATHPTPTPSERRTMTPGPTSFPSSSSPPTPIPTSSPPTTTTPTPTPTPTERESRYKRERDLYLLHTRTLEQSLSALQATLARLTSRTSHLEQALSVEAASKTDLISDLDRKRVYCESLGSAKAETERRVLEMKLVERKLRGQVESERESGRKGERERESLRRELEEVKGELAREREARGEREREKERERNRSVGEEYWKELQAAKDELARAEKQHEVTRRLLEEKAEELKGVQLFASRADEVSVADVIALVNSLNAEILQAAAFVADSLHFSTAPGEQVAQEDMSKATKIVVNALGQDIAKAVWVSRRPKRGQEHEYDPTVVQYALQVAMTKFCESVINDWAPNPDANSWLESIYATIQTKESQAVAGRWRALTRAQLGGAKEPNFIVKHLVDRLVNILIVAGCSRSQVQVDNFREKFKDHLAAIANVSIRVQTAAGEAITSVDIKTYTCPPGENFTTEYMEDTYSESSSRDIGKPIAGTTELGLLKKEQKGQSEPVYTPLVKAKVILAAVLRE